MILSGILLHVVAKILANIMDDSVCRCDEIMESNNEETKAVPTSLNRKKVACKNKISLPFY